jgi:hypothetical protein
MQLPSIHANREAWLNAAVDELRPFFSSRGHTLPAEIRVATGYPTNAKRSGFKVLGECIPNTNSADGHYEIWISPILADPHQGCRDPDLPVVPHRQGCADRDQPRLCPCR